MPGATVVDAPHWEPQPGPQSALIACPVEDVLFGGARGGGKCLPLTEPVLTPFGWRELGEIEPGSQVCNPNGTVSRVLATYRPGGAQTWRITFSDGATATCDDGHIWLGRFVGHRVKRGGFKLWRFGDIRRKYAETEDPRFLIPLTEPVTFTRPRFTRHGDRRPLDGYLLGVLLGDGSLTGDSVRYSTADDEIDHAMAAFGVVRVDDGPNRRLVECPDVLAGLRLLGVWGKGALEKFVPDAYLWADTETRWAVLQGLMDTDGTADSRGQCYFASSSRELAEGVQFLCRSLGFKATLWTKQTTHEPSHQVYVRGPSRDRLFRLPRKRERAAGPYQRHHSVRRIVSIDPAEVCEVGCFQVDDPNGLFVTRDFVVTHNTDGLLGDWISHADRYGENAHGILFRRTFPELEEIQKRAEALFPALGAHWGAVKRTWRFPAGATLKLRYMERDAQASRYQGHQYTWIGLDELTHWGTPEAVDKLRATLRSAHGVKCLMRATANPGGPGHNWVKARYIDPAPPYQPFTANDTQRVFIPSRLDDNRVLLENDPEYWRRVAAAAGGNEALLKAWRWGIWDIVAGGMFDDLWRPDRHTLPVFDVPDTWPVFRAFDWGSSKPFSVGWWAKANGEAAKLPDGRVFCPPAGSLIRIAEWYGWDGKTPNTGLRMTDSAIGKGIVEREARMGLRPRVRPGPADDSIFDADPGKDSTATELERQGATFEKAGKSPGSRKRGWEAMRRMLEESARDRPEAPGLYVVESCRQFVRTVPVLPRSGADPDDVDTDSEDHIADEARYVVLWPFRETRTFRFKV